MEVALHELSIAQSIVELACEQADGHDASKVLRIAVEIGLLSGVEREALEFCFPIACRDTKADGAHLDVTIQPAKARCPKCNESFLLDDLVLVCPRCGAYPVELLAGGNLKVLFVEVE